MDTAEIIEALKAERDRLDTAISALQGSRYGRGKRGKRKLSPAARKRISDAMKKRWKERKKAKS